MKYFFTSLLALLILVGCSSSSDKAEPVMRKYLTTRISNPETYTAGEIEILKKGTINVANTRYWKHIPSKGIIKVVVLRHKFTNKNSEGTTTDNAYYFYMNPDLDVVYYAHPDNGGGQLFSPN